jgi:hypothetical protein
MLRDWMRAQLARGLDRRDVQQSIDTSELGDPVGIEGASPQYGRRGRCLD